MAHIALLGDSIFDNARYVPGGPSVIQHLERMLPTGWRGTLVAVDGSETTTMAAQFRTLPADASHLVLSIGGNDALGCRAVILREPARSYSEVLTRMEEIRVEFQRNYRSVLDALISYGKPAVACTIYDAIPGLEAAELAGLCLFNDVITREAFRRKLSLIDLRLICCEARDYASTSPIEPSVAGGYKIAQAICRAVSETEGQPGGSRVFA
jgi:GDSL-like Lipase/Acylhydrolase family